MPTNRRCNMSLSIYESKCVDLVSGAHAKSDKFPNVFPYFEFSIRRILSRRGWVLLRPDNRPLCKSKGIGKQNKWLCRKTSNREYLWMLCVHWPIFGIKAYEKRRFEPGKSSSFHVWLFFLWTRCEWTKKNGGKKRCLIAPATSSTQLKNIKMSLLHLNVNFKVQSRFDQEKKDSQWLKTRVGNFIWCYITRRHQCNDAR